MASSQIPLPKGRVNCLDMASELKLNPSELPKTLREGRLIYSPQPEDFNRPDYPKILSDNLASELAVLGTYLRKTLPRSKFNNIAICSGLWALESMATTLTKNLILYKKGNFESFPGFILAGIMWTNVIHQFFPTTSNLPSMIPDKLLAISLSPDTGSGPIDFIGKDVVDLFTLHSNITTRTEIGAWLIQRSISKYVVNFLIPDCRMYLNLNQDQNNKTGCHNLQLNGIITELLKCWDTWTTSKLLPEPQAEKKPDSIGAALGLTRALTQGDPTYLSLS